MYSSGLVTQKASNSTVLLMSREYGNQTRSLSSNHIRNIQVDLVMGSAICLYLFDEILVFVKHAHGFSFFFCADESFKVWSRLKIRMLS